jgi:hypothetical protein
MNTETKNKYKRYNEAFKKPAMGTGCSVAKSNAP